MVCLNNISTAIDFTLHSSVPDGFDTGQTSVHDLFLSARGMQIQGKGRKGRFYSSDWQKS